MLEKIINSKTRLAILSLFYQNKDAEFYGREIINKLKLDQASVHKELANLVKSGLVKITKNDEKKYYSLNQDNFYFNGFAEIFHTYNNKAGNEWFILEEMPSYHPMFVASAWSVDGANKFFKKIKLSNRFSNLIAVYQENICTLGAKREEFNRISLEIIDKLKDDYCIGEKYIDEVLKIRNEFMNYSKEFETINLKSMTNKELYSIFAAYFGVYEKYHRLHWMHTALDFGDNFFSKYLLGYLKSLIKDKKNSVGEVFSILTTPTDENTTTQEYRDLLKILDKINQNKELRNYFKNTETRIITENLKDINDKLYVEIKNHSKKYGWIGYGVTGPSWGEDYFIDVLSSLARQGSDVTELLRVMDENKKNIQKRQDELINELKIDVKHKNLFRVARGIVYTKGARKEGLFFAWSVMENFYKEVSHRFYLSMKQLRYMYPHEYKNLLLNKQFSAKKLNDRYKYSLHYSSGNYDKDVLLENEEAEKMYKSLSFVKEEIGDVKMLNGDCASSGRARGRAVIVNEVKDMEQMKKGDVLISIATNPDLVPAIRKASAIVTDMGGITCHAAIVSRELNIPCVIGTKIATKVLKNGDLLDVDATHGKVVVLKKNDNKKNNNE